MSECFLHVGAMLREDPRTEPADTGYSGLDNFLDDCDLHVAKTFGDRIKQCRASRAQQRQVVKKLLVSFEDSIDSSVLADGFFSPPASWVNSLFTKGVITGVGNLQNRWQIGQGTELKCGIAASECHSGCKRQRMSALSSPVAYTQKTPTLWRLEDALSMPFTPAKVPQIELEGMERTRRLEILIRDNVWQQENLGGTSSNNM